MPYEPTERPSAPLIPTQRRLSPRAASSSMLGAILVIGFVVALSRNHPVNQVAAAKVEGAHEEGKAEDASLVEVYLGNGCFWERQWAYYVVETAKGGPFVRAPVDITARTGYAGGTPPPADSPSVCYHTGDGRDYGRLGHAEVVRVALDRARAREQMAMLARDFFASFQGPSGRRSRPDPMDRGRPYRSVVGLPGGMNSTLYDVFAQENAFGMNLKPGRGGDADEFNTVWVVDTGHFPFFLGEAYHQMHCNFFMSEGMPYPDDYVVKLWNELKAEGRVVSTGCPESGSHRRC